LKYRSFEQSDSERLRDAILENEEIEIDQLGQEVGEGDLFDLKPARDLCRQAVDLCSSGASPEVVELEFSGALYLLLRDVPVAVRDDAGFWRWVSAAALLPFLLIRDTPMGKPLGKEAIGAGTNASDILACRMFLRAQVAQRTLANGELDFSLLSALGPKHHDFWQSHILRVSTGSERNIAHALIDSHHANHIPTSELRKFVRDRINRPKTTVATYLMSESEAVSYVARQREIFSSEVQKDDLD
jgi:hypothetical protein